MKMKQNKYQQDLEAKASLNALREGIEISLMKDYLQDNSLPSAEEHKLRGKVEKLLNGSELSEWQRGGKKRAEACRRAFIKGIKAGDKTE